MANYLGYNTPDLYVISICVFILGFFRTRSDKKLYNKNERKEKDWQ